MNSAKERKKPNSPSAGHWPKSYFGFLLLTFAQLMSLQEMTRITFHHPVQRRRQLTRRMRSRLSRRRRDRRTSRLQGHQMVLQEVQERKRKEKEDRLFWKPCSKRGINHNLVGRTFTFRDLLISCLVLQNIEIH